VIICNDVFAGETRVFLFEVLGGSVVAEQLMVVFIAWANLVVVVAVFFLGVRVDGDIDHSFVLLVAFVLPWPFGVEHHL
jgi:hypothetical protein